MKIPKAIERTFPRRLREHEAGQQERRPGGQAGGLQLRDPVRGQAGHQVHQVLQGIFRLLLLALFQSGGGEPRSLW